MSLSSEQSSTLSIYQTLLQALVNILDKETTIDETNRASNGISDENIVNLNNSIQNTLYAINHIVASTYLIPTIISFTPTSGDEGSSVTITGTNFAGAEVYFNGVLASIISSTDEEIVCQVPEELQVV